MRNNRSRTVIVLYGLGMLVILIAAALTRSPEPATNTSSSPPTPYPTLVDDRPIRQLTYPADYRETFVHYATIDRIDNVSRNLYINPEAVEAVRQGETVPFGSIIVIEAFFVPMDESGRPQRDEQGHMIQGEFDPEVHMAERRDDWRIVELAATSHVGGWNFGAFDSVTGNLITGELSDCFSCHEGARNSNFLFTSRVLQDYARTDEVQYLYCGLPDRGRCSF